MEQRNPRRRKRRSWAVAAAAEGGEDKRPRDASGEEDEKEAKEEAAAVAVRADKQFEYMDHTADIQLHAWGATLAEAFEFVVIAMNGYMTELDAIDIDPACTVTVRASGHDKKSLLFSLLDEFLAVFSTEDVICREVRVVEMDLRAFKLTAKGYGEKFSLQKHPQGTEVKAITYSNMQIHDDGYGRADVYVIVDI